MTGLDVRPGCTVLMTGLEVGPGDADAIDPIPGMRLTADHCP